MCGHDIDIDKTIYPRIEELIPGYTVREKKPSNVLRNCTFITFSILLYTLRNVLKTIKKGHLRAFR
jgi:hypothetical protein